MNRLTHEYFETLLSRTDKTGMHAIGRALVVLSERQIIYEASRGAYAEGEFGFVGSDASIGASMAAFYQRRGMLTIAQLCFWQVSRNMQKPRINKYIDQLIMVARGKQAKSPETDLWTALNLAVWKYYDVLDSDSADYIVPAEAEVKLLAEKLGMDFGQALNVCGSGEVSGVMKN